MQNKLDILLNIVNKNCKIVWPMSVCIFVMIIYARNYHKFEIVTRLGDYVTDGNRGGRNAFLQFSGSLLVVNQKSSYDDDYLNDSKFTYDHKVEAMQDGSVRFTITERYCGDLTKGGSSFLATREIGAVCRLRDHFNGTYSGICDARSRYFCSTLIVVLQGVRFLLFRKQLNPLERIIMNVSNVCTNSLTADNIKSHFKTYGTVTWEFGKMVNETRITQTFGRPAPQIMNHTTICRLVSQHYEHVTMIGASHTRYQFDYLLEHCYPGVLLVIRKHGTFSVGNIDYREAKFMEDYPEIVKQHLNSTEYTTSGNSLTTVQVGSHDINTAAFKDIVSSLDSYVDAVRLLCESNLKSVMVLAAPPFPDHDKRLFARHWRNNHAIAALNYMVEIRVRQLMKIYSKLDYFDVFNALLPWQNHDVSICGHHYMCRIPKRGVFGDVGISMFELIMTKLLTPVDIE